MAQVNKQVVQELFIDESKNLYLKTLTGETHKIEGGGPGGGVTVLSDLTDVDTAGVVNNYVLRYNSSAGEWQATAETQYAGSNGITLNSGTFELGGDLTKDTLIRLGPTNNTMRTLSIVGIKPGGFAVNPSPELIINSTGIKFEMWSTAVNVSRLQLTTSDLIFTQNTGNSGTIKYAADYSGSYTNRSLVDKEYVDTRTATFSNIVLHGTTTNFDSGLTFWVLPATNAYELTIQKLVDSGSFSPSIILGENSSSIGIDDGVSENAKFVFNQLPGVGTITLSSTSPNTFLYPQGSNATTANALVNKNYVDTHLGGSILSFTKGSGTNGHTIVWDNALSQFVSTPLNTAFWKVDDTTTLSADTTITTGIGSVNNLILRNRVSASSNMELRLINGVSGLFLTGVSSRTVSVELGNPYVVLQNINSGTLTGSSFLLSDVGVDFQSRVSGSVDKYIRYNISSGTLDYDVNRSGSYTNRSVVDKEYVDDAIALGAEANTSSNLGGGEGIFAQKVGVDFQFKSLVAGSNISLSSSGTEITISTDGSSTPENTQVFNGDGVTTVFNVTSVEDTVSVFLVDVGGVVQVRGTDYTVSNKTVTFISGAPINGSKVGIHFFTNITAGSITIEQTRTQSTTTVPSSKLFDDQLIIIEDKTTGVNSTGSIQLDRLAPRVYGESALLTGNVVIDLTNSFVGGSAIVHHNDSTKPTIVTDLDLMEHGDYVNDTLNQVFLLRSGTSTLSVAYTQPIFTAGTVDLTAPTISSATIENGNENRLIVVFSEPVNIVNVLGLSITGDATITVTSIVSGSGTNTITFAIDPVAQTGQSLTFNVTASNTITDLSSNSNPLAPTTFAITNNVGVIQQLNTPTGFEATNLSPTSIRLDWNSVTDADNYVLERGVQTDYSDAVAIYTGPLLTFDDSGLTEDTTYYYRVKAIDDVDNIYSDSNYATLNIVATDSIFSILQAEAGWYNFTNKTVGAFSQFTEEKGNYTTGNVAGSPEYIAGTRLDFTRADNDVISLGSPFTFLKDSTDGFSIYLKFNPKSLGFVTYFLGQTETNHQVVVAFNASNQIQVFTKINSASVVINTVTTALFTGSPPFTPKHVFIDFVKSTQEVKFYIDSSTVEAPKTANNLIGNISLYNPTEQWYLGARNVSGSADVANSFDGIFDHVIINNKLLTSTEKQLIIDNA